MSKSKSNSQTISLSILPESSADEILSLLEAHPELSAVDWNIVEPRVSTLIIVRMNDGESLRDLRPLDPIEDMSEDEIRDRINNVLGNEASFADRVQYSLGENSIDVLMKLLASKKIVLPIPRCMSDFVSLMKQREIDTVALLNATPKTMETEFYGPSVSPEDNFFCKVQLHHPKTIERFGTKPIMDSRARNRLARSRSNYHPLLPVNTEVESVYASSVKPMAEHVASVMKAGESLSEFGITSDPTNMAYSQINIGMPFFGGVSRKKDGFNNDLSELTNDLQRVAEVHVRGLAEKYSELGESEFKLMNSHVTVPVYSYQGPATNTTSHVMNQVMWASMLASDEGLFLYEDLILPTGIGFRLQASKGKIRDSWIVFEDSKVGLSHTIDGIHTDIPVIAFSEGIVGARVRHVENPNHVQNHAQLTVPSYIGDTKSPEYKLALNVSFGTLMSIVPGTEEFRDMWTEAWHNLPIVQVFAKQRGITDLNTLLSTMYELGEFPWVGDIGNFDGNTNFSLAGVGLEHIEHERLFKLTRLMWNQPTIGAYVGANDEVCYYTIDKRDESTAEASDMLGSGLGTTSVIGRTIVPAVLGHAMRHAFDIDIDTYYQYPTAKGVSPFSLTQRNAGDDHAISMMFLWLATGIHPRECLAKLEEQLIKDNFYKIEPENPPLCAGFQAHLADDGRLIDWSLSPTRCFSNNTNPENTKSALGVDSSIEVYTNSAIGTELEGPMNEVTSTIMTEVYDFQSIDELEAGRSEDERAMEEGIGRFSPDELIANELGIPVNELHYKYSYSELLDMGIDEEVLSTWKKPIPSALTQDPSRFFNMETIKKIANDYENRVTSEIDTNFVVSELPTSRIGKTTYVK